MYTRNKKLYKGEIMKKKNKGFTLIEMLVVVLIIGILASVALPQYQMAVTKAKVASILPLMRRWKDALAEYKLQHGNYDDLDYETGGAILGVSWPSDWKQNANSNLICGDYVSCKDSYWECGVESNNPEDNGGMISCAHNDVFTIHMAPHDNPYFPNQIICYAESDEGHKICKALGGKITEDGEDYILY